MKSRYLFMILIGGVIGIGFFLNLGYIINEVGFGGVVLVYFVVGFLMYLVMFCFGELIVFMLVIGLF